MAPQKPVSAEVPADGPISIRFDRGTLVVGAARGAIGPDIGLTWDARVDAYRAPARFHDDLVRRLGLRSEVRSPLPPAPAPRSDRPLALRPYQEAALAAWERAGRRGVVCLPTGAGKTRLAIAAIASARLRTLCLVPTRVLLEQWLLQLRETYADTIGCLGDGEHAIAPITVATFESGYRYMDRLGASFELLVVDEAHHFGAGLRDEALEMSVASARLGLTATPPRQSDAAARLAALIGPTVLELSVSDLSGRFLATFDLITLYVDLTRDERLRYATSMAPLKRAWADYRSLAPAGAHQWAAFAAWAGRSAEGRAALAGWREARLLLGFTEGKRAAVASLLAQHRQSRTLVFTPDNETAYTIAREHLISPLTRDIARKERDEVLERFRAGTVRALVSARVLNEGLDVPDAEVAIIVGGTLGEREHVQRVGRLLRPREGKRAVAYELVARGTMEVAQARRRRAPLAPRSTPQV